MYKLVLISQLLNELQPKDVIYMEFKDHFSGSKHILLLAHLTIIGRLLCKFNGLLVIEVWKGNYVDEFGIRDIDDDVPKENFKSIYFYILSNTVTYLQVFDKLKGV